MIELSGHIDENGVAKIHNNKELSAWFLKHAGKDFKIKVERKFKKRSNSQNAYYFGCVIPLINERLRELGNEFSNQDVHEAMKSKFCVGEIVNENGVQEEFVRSTATLRTVEFMEYLDKITVWAAQFLGITIPLPNEAIEIDFK